MLTTIDTLALDTVSGGTVRSGSAASAATLQTLQTLQTQLASQSQNNNNSNLPMMMAMAMLAGRRRGPDVVYYGW